MLKHSLLLNKKIYAKNSFIYSSYYVNMKVQNEGEFINSIKEGIWTDYDESGNKIKEVFYKNGIPDLDSMKLFDPTIELIDTSSIEIKVSTTPNSSKKNNNLVMCGISGIVFKKNNVDNHKIIK
mgnify:CR=1 FL=1